MAEASASVNTTEVTKSAKHLSILKISLSKATAKSPASSTKPPGNLALFEITPEEELTPPVASTHPFRFSDLPRVIQIIILEFLFTRGEIFIMMFQARKLYAIRSEFPTQMLCVSRLFNEVGRTILYGRNAFAFYRTAAFNKFLKSANLGISLHHVRLLHTLLNEMLFCELKRLRSLQTLTITMEFKNPSLPTPLGQRYLQLGLRFRVRQRLFGRIMPEKPTVEILENVKVKVAAEQHSVSHGIKIITAKTTFKVIWNVHRADYGLRLEARVKSELE